MKLNNLVQGFIMKMGRIHIEWLKRSVALIIILHLYMSGLSQGSNASVAPFTIRLDNGQGFTYAQVGFSKNGTLKKNIRKNVARADIADQL